MISRRGIEQAVGVAALALLAAGCFLVLRPFLPAILWAAILAFATRPIYMRLAMALGGRETLAAALMVVAMACVVVVPLAGLGWIMAEDVARLFASVRGWFEHGLPGPPAWLAAIPIVGGRIAMRWQQLAEPSSDLFAQLGPYTGTARAWLLAISAGFASALFELLLSLALAFFLYRDGPICGEVVASIGERLTGERAGRLIAVAGSTIRSVVVGLIGTNLIQATLGGLGFWAAGVPNAFLLGFAVFFLTIIPFGPVVVWVPAVLWLINAGKTTEAVLLAVWCGLIFQVMETLLRVYFAGRGNPLPAVLVLLGMLGGLTAFGILGIFLGPTLLAIAYTLIEEWRAPTKPDVRPVPSRG